MTTKESSASTDESEAAERTGEAGARALVGDEAKPKRSTRPISARVSIEDLALIDSAARRREMKRGDLIALAVLQFIGRAHAGARRTKVVVPDDVRREVRSSQETMDRLGVEMNRVGKNLLVQLRRHWAGEPAAVSALDEAELQLRLMRKDLDQVARDLRTVMDRPEW